jgi:hypothetical protein
MLSKAQKEILADTIDGEGVSREWGGYRIIGISFHSPTWEVEGHRTANVLITVTRTFPAGGGEADYEETDAYFIDGSRCNELSSTRALDNATKLIVS